MVRSIMAYADLPMSFWTEAVKTGSYILNTANTKVRKLTDSEYWIGNLSNFKGIWL